jgi:excisionase family DNA binding protein
LTLDHTLALMDREVIRVFIDLTPHERREVEAALPAIAPISGAAADVLRRVLVGDQNGAGTEHLAESPEAYASISEAARVFCVTPQTIRNWVDKGLLRAYRTPAGTRRISREALQRVAAFRASPRPGPKFSDAEIDEIIEHMRDE